MGGGAVSGSIGQSDAARRRRSSATPRPQQRPAAAGAPLLIVAGADSAESVFLGVTLKRAGYSPSSVEEPLEALRIIASAPVTSAPKAVIVVAEVARRDMNLGDFVRRMRDVTGIPILIVTRGFDANEEIVALQSGADAYLSRPVTAGRVEIHVQCLLGRRRSTVVADGADESGAELRSCGFRLRLDTREAWSGRSILELTRTEYELLAELVGAHGAVVTRKHLLERIAPDAGRSEHAVDVHMSRLRRKLRDTAGDGSIVTVRGVGFRCVVHADQVPAQHEDHPA